MKFPLKLPYIPNYSNKDFIDRWVNKYYRELFKKFDRYKLKINSRGYSSTDILHETLIKYYMLPKNFKSYEQCERVLNKYFKINDKS